MKKSFTDGEIPLGFGMALAQNTAALDSFALLSDKEKKEIIGGAHYVNSREEMRKYVDDLTEK